MKDQEYWIDLFSALGALWIHDGNPKRPHALLTSGNHSNGFFNGSEVIFRHGILENVCKDLISKLRLHVGPSLYSSFNVVVGSAMGAVTMAYEIASITGSNRGFTEPEVIDGEKFMTLKRFNVEGSSVLIVEDVVTTGGTTLRTADAVRKAGGSVFDTIAVMVNRSGKKSIGDYSIVSLIDYEMLIWTPEKCPLCKKGSEAIRPKYKDNWGKLNAEY